VMPSVLKRYSSYAAFGASTVGDIFPAADVASATTLEAHTFASTIALNSGRGGFTLQPLPIEAQIAPVNAAVSGDFDGDGHVDLVLAGNFFATPPIQGRYDASYGLLLRGSGDGRFSPVAMPRSGVQIDGQVRRMQVVHTPDAPLVAIARNNASLLLLKPNTPTRPEPLAIIPRRRVARAEIP
jgi:hypothetical protein